MSSFTSIFLNTSTRSVSGHLPTILVTLIFLLLEETTVIFVIFFFRNCIGQEFAMNELQLVLLSYVLRKFDFSLDESHGPVKNYYTIINHPIPGVYLKLHPRI